MKIYSVPNIISVKAIQRQSKAIEEIINFMGSKNVWKVHKRVLIELLKSTVHPRDYTLSPILAVPEWCLTVFPRQKNWWFGLRKKGRWLRRV